MITAGYTLDLYCDTEGGCPRNRIGGQNNPVEFTGEYGSKCRSAARRAGWLLKRDGTCFCRDHRAEHEKSTSHTKESP